MSSENLSAYLLSGLIEDYFSIESQIFSRHSVVAFKAIDRGTEESICLWVARSELKPDGLAASAFLQRIEAFHANNLASILSWGIDSNGIGFVVAPPLDGQPLFKPGLDRTEAERRFVQCVRIIAQVHEAGLSCGDLSADSFWVDREGFVQLINVIGLATVPYTNTDHSEASEEPDLEFFAPEVARSEILTASDVFSLGILAFKLFLERQPFAHPAVLGGEVELASSLFLSPKFPVWADSVLPKCLMLSANERLLSASDIIKLISEARTVSSEQSLALIPQKRTTQKASQNVGAVKISLGANRSKALKGRPQDQDLPVPTTKSAGLPIGRVGLFSFIGLVICLTGLILGGLDSKKESSVTEDVADAKIPVGSRDNVASYLQQMVTSDDPLAHDVIIRLAHESKTLEQRRMAEDAIYNRAKRLGLFRSAEQMRSWLSLFTEAEPQSYEDLLRLVDPALPADRREATLKQAYLAHGPFIVRLACALALDLKQPDQFQPILAPLIGDLLHIPDTKDHSTAALILAVPELSSAFGEDALELLERSDGDDLLWLLDILGRRTDGKARIIAKMAFSRGMIPAAKSVYVDVLVSRSDLAGNVLSALISGLRGELQSDDLTAFGTWYDLDSEKVLLAVCADKQTPELAETALDMLSGKSLSNEFVARIMDWTKRHAWTDRIKLAQSIGIIGLINRFSAQEIRQAVEAFDTVGKDSELVRILLQSDTPAVLSATMETFSSLLDTSAMLRLLSHSQKGVRIFAVKALSKVNDIGALKMILDAYKVEGDEEVRAVFREYIPVIKEREAKR